MSESEVLKNYRVELQEVVSNGRIDNTSHSIKTLLLLDIIVLGKNKIPGELSTLTSPMKLGN